MLNRLIILSSLLLCSCQEEPIRPFPKGPVLPPPVVYEDILDHPWLKQQTGVEEILPAIVEDVRSIQRLNIPWEQIQKKYDELQKEIHTLPVTWPSYWYQVLQIPPASSFRIYRRMLVGENHLGFPIYLDVRVFELKDATQVAEILDWHFKLLKDEPFQKIDPYPNVFVGRGDHNTLLFNPTHGIASKDRGIFLAYFLKNQKLFVLFLDAPWFDFVIYYDNLLSILN